MELRTLASFVAVATAASVSGAARQLHITQPALSRQIHQLERELAVDLFTRGGGRLALSAAGRQFLPLAREVLKRAADAERAAATIAAGRLEQVTIAAPTTTLTDVIAPFVATFGPADPVPNVLDTTGQPVAAALHLGADLVVTTEPPPDTLAHTAVAVLPVWAYVPPDHRWHASQQVDVEELVTETVIALSPAFKARDILDHALERAGVTAHRLIECTNPQVAQALAAAGRGVAVVTDDPRFDLCGIRLRQNGEALRIHLHATWDTGHHAHALLGELAQRLREFCVERYGPQTLPDPGGRLSPPRPGRGSPQPDAVAPGRSGP
ncbi:LysR family transcriptional regulator [Phytohabitans suffuscus]|uniref:LysR family transcriptional regulator n=1 Tax=Phytohabitans suffuscus TaxID=624315 RepID=A0A6F8YUP8_9ACTN|nr:LysR family transcriptional regulator [Phytohabitans suffuscus]BCB89776.1 LysR family transcriptional regulator [Phytohabitans suffuscus]